MCSWYVGVVCDIWYVWGVCLWYVGYCVCVVYSMECVWYVVHVWVYDVWGVCIGMVYVCVLCVIHGVLGTLVCMWGVSVWCDIWYDGVSVARGVRSVCGMWGEEYRYVCGE